MTELKRQLTETLNRLKKDKKAFFAVIIGITGMLLVCLSELTDFSADEKAEQTEAASYYDESIREQTSKLISEIKGAGKVSVMLTYESSEETVWAKDYDEKLQTQGDLYSQKHIIIDSGDTENGLAVKVIYPKVRGVAVVCSGGDNPTVKSEIKALLTALFDIGSNRISIAPRAAKE